MTTIMKRNVNGQAPATTFGGLVDQLFQDNLGRFFDDSFWGFNGSLSRNQVPVNIRDNGNAWELNVIAPGLDKNDFKVQLTDGLLTVSAEHKEEKQEGKGDWVRREYRHQAFSRSFTLDDTVDGEKVEAKYTNGVLQLTLPKKPAAQKATKAIEIQ
ncbi:MAG TPA: Hsp20/alpha crystallin family protein [Chitinophagaceae bacterium]|nr:Hsp20/alpha crystallin family protein [Chitinophagaceae bacterium]